MRDNRTYFLYDARIKMYDELIGKQWLRIEIMDCIAQGLKYGVDIIAFEYINSTGTVYQLSEKEIFGQRKHIAATKKSAAA